MQLQQAARGILCSHPPGTGQAMAPVHNHVAQGSQGVEGGQASVSAVGAVRDVEALQTCKTAEAMEPSVC